MRLATWHIALSRDGPGLLLRDIVKGEDAEIARALRTISEAQPDVLLLTGIDSDPGGATARGLQDALADIGWPLPHAFAPASNAGLPTALDLDGDGRTGTARDAQGYGRFRGDGAMLLLSRLPLEANRAADLSGVLWRDLPGAQLPTEADGAPFPSASAQEVQRLSSTGHWVVPLTLPNGAPLTIFAYAATPPVFDGPEDRNGLRNADETRAWLGLLDGTLGLIPPETFAILGRANLDPVDGDGRHAAIRALLSDPRVQDPAPESPESATAADPEHAGDPALDTADWRSVAEGGPGNLRVDYVLPSATLAVRDAGVLWPSRESGSDTGASQHGLVWVDVALP
ncbi:MAG: endonuclease/exonuclease/phosphatase family protein [Pseudomonadota bacterium]